MSPHMRAKERKARVAEFAFAWSRYADVSHKDALAEAERICTAHGEAMLKRMIWWLADPEKSESPIAQRERFVEFMTNKRAKLAGKDNLV